MKLILFETKGSENLYPLTYLRAAFELKCGHTTLEEKITRAAGTVSEKAYFVRKMLEPTFKQRNPGCRVNDPGMLMGDDLLIVDGRVLTLEGLSLPEGEGIIMEGNNVAIARVNKNTASSLPNSNLEEFLDAVSSRLPETGKQATVIHYLWDLLTYNAEAITADFKAAASSGIEGTMDELSCVYGPKDQCFVAPGAEIHPMVVLDTRSGPVTIAKDAVVFPHTRIEGPSYIGPGTQIVGGKIREGCSIGPVCRIGGEVEETIIHGYSNKFHDGFIGHAYIGEWVNLGALTTNSDLKNDYTNVEVKIGGKMYNTGSTKVGSFIGDHTKTSIGTLLNTGSFIGIMCLLVASGVPLPKFIPSFMWYFNGRFSRGTGFKNLIKTAHAVTGRRNRTLSEEDISLLETVYDMTREERDLLIKRASKAMLKR